MIIGIIMDNTRIIIIIVDMILFVFLLLKFIVFSPLYYYLFRKEVTNMLGVVGLLLFLFLWMRFEGQKASRKAKIEKDAYWKKEREANNTRKVDITGLDYIIIPIDRLPFVDDTDEVQKALQASVKALSKEPILNLTGFSNTDLKLQYGVANITFLSVCDSNYTQLVNSLYKWGSYLDSINKISEAITVLEFGIQCKTDNSKHYLLLANLYIKTNVPNKIDDLIIVAESLQTIMKESILSNLRKIKLSTYLV